MNIWGTILFNIKIVFPVCVVCVCVVQGLICLCLSVLPWRPERRQVFSLSTALCLTFCLWPGFHWTRSLALQPVCWRSTLGPCLPSSAGVTGMFSHTQLVTWALGFELRSEYPSPQSQVPSPKIPLVMKSTFICLSSILHKDVFFFMIRPTPLPPAPSMSPSASPPPGAVGCFSL